MEELFSCKRCGYCCQGETTVSLSKDDQEIMLDSLGISREEAFKKYWVQKSSEVQMRTVEGHCIFYDEGCVVHEGRPWRCREWPLVPAILLGEENLVTIRTSCPGLTANASYSAVCEAVKRTAELKEKGLL